MDEDGSRFGLGRKPKVIREPHEGLTGMSTWLDEDVRIPASIELRAFETFAGAACCQAIELPSDKAAPLQALGERSLCGLHSCSFAIAIRAHWGCYSWCQFDTGSNSGYYVLAL
jgi:hypothetical protein